MNYFDVKLVVFFNRNGDIAQLARAPALQAGGPGFESLYLHQDKVSILFDSLSWLVCYLPVAPYNMGWIGRKSAFTPPISFHV